MLSTPPLQSPSSQINLTSYATNPADHPTLEKLSAVIPRLNQDELVGLAIASLNEGFEPDTMNVDFGIITPTFNQCIQLLQDLSQAGKVALVRCLAELLAISLGIASISSTPTLPSLPPVPAPHPENAWGLLSLEDAICFCNAGLLDAAIVAWLYPPRSLQAVAPTLLKILQPQPHSHKESEENHHVSKSH